MDALEEGYIVSVAFIDARAGFDTLLNSFLLRKLQMIGYPESTMDCKAPFSNPEGADSLEQKSGSLTRC